MKIHLKVHRWAPIVTLSVIVIIAFSCAPHLAVRLPPSFVYEVPTSVFVGIVPALLINFGALPQVGPLNRLSTRNLARYDSLTLLAAVVISSMVIVASYEFAASGEITIAFRNFLGLLGLGLVGQGLFGQLASWLLPTTCFLVMVVSGVDSSNQMRWWAWMIAPGADAFSLGVGLIFFGLGYFVVTLRNVIREQSIFALRQ